jgi:nucleotide-binding universal stress UspA family protein
MNRIESILVATDFSPHAGNALARAALVATEHGARLHLLHVVNRSLFRRVRDLIARRAANADVEAKLAQTHDALSALARNIAASHGIEVSAQVRVGNALHEVRRAAHGFDMVVLGIRGLDSLRDLVRGSTASRLHTKCDRPMLVVKQPAHNSYRRVLVPMNRSRSAAAIRAAMRLAPNAGIRLLKALRNDREAEMRLADVSEPVIQAYRTKELARARAQMREIASEFHDGDALMRISVEYSDVLDMTLRHDVQTNADLIVAHSHRKSSISNLLLGSVTRRLLRHARCDVLLVAKTGLEAPQSRPVVAPAGELAAAEGVRA